MNVRVDETGPNRVDANAFLRNLLREPHRERVDRGFGGSVVHVLARRAEPRGALRSELLRSSRLTLALLQILRRFTDLGDEEIEETRFEARRLLVRLPHAVLGPRC